jgi:hypothetical protein
VLRPPRELRLLLAALALALALPAAAVAATTPITSFEDLLQLLSRGNRVRAVFHFARCTLTSDGVTEPQGPDAVGAMPLDTFEYFAPGSVGNKVGYLSFSSCVFVRHPGYGNIYNYCKVRVSADGQVRMDAQFLKASTFEVQMDETFGTTLDKGDGTAGATFWLVD